MLGPDQFAAMSVADPSDLVAVAEGAVLPSAPISVDIGVDRIRVGSGFNAFTGEAGGQAAKYDSAADLEQVAPGNGKLVRYNLRQVTSLDELRRTLDVSAAASLGWGAFKASATFALTEQSFVSSYDVFLLADVDVQLPALLLKSKMLTDPAFDRVEAGYSAFLDFCGTSFVHGYVLGGRISCLLRFSTRSASHQKAVSASVEAAVTNFAASGKASASFSESLTELKKQSSIELRFIRDGGVGVLPGVDGLIQACQAFPDQVTADTAVIKQLLALPYPTMDNWPLQEPTIDMARLENHGRKINLIADNLMRAYQVRSDAAYAAAHPETFITPENAKVPEHALRTFSTAEAIIGQLLSELQALRRDADRPAIAPPELQPLALKRVEEEEVIVPPPPPPPKPIQLFEHADFQGRCVETDEAIPDFAAIGFNDVLSSVRVVGKPAQYKIELFQGAHFKGASLTLIGPAEIRSMHDHVWATGPSGIRFRANDQVSSLMIHRLY